MRTMHIEDIWSRRDNGEPRPHDDEDPEAYTRYTRVRHVDVLRYKRTIRRPDGEQMREKRR